MHPDCEVYITVLGGLPVLAQVWIEPADYEVGIWQPSIDDYILCHHKTGKPHNQWIYNRIEKDGVDKVYDAIWKALERVREESLCDQAEYLAECRRDYEETRYPW